VARIHSQDAIGVLIELMQESSNDGVRLRAAVELLDRSHGRAPREVAEAISLPEDVSLAGKADAIMAAMSSGQITVARGAQLIDALSGVAKIREATVLESRLRAVEDKIGAEDAEH
jgi:hypothetical protein